MYTEIMGVNWWCMFPLFTLSLYMERGNILTPENKFTLALVFFLVTEILDKDLMNTEYSSLMKWQLQKNKAELSRPQWTPVWQWLLRIASQRSMLTVQGILCCSEIILLFPILHMITTFSCFFYMWMIFKYDATLYIYGNFTTLINKDEFFYLLAFFTMYHMTSMYININFHHVYYHA